MVSDKISCLLILFGLSLLGGCLTIGPAMELRDVKNVMVGTSPNVLYAATSEEFYHSSDSGETWTAILSYISDSSCPMHRNTLVCSSPDADCFAECGSDGNILRISQSNGSSKVVYTPTIEFTAADSKSFLFSVGENSFVTVLFTTYANDVTLRKIALAYYRNETSKHSVFAPSSGNEEDLTDAYASPNGKFVVVQSKEVVRIFSVVEETFIKTIECGRVYQCDLTRNGSINNNGDLLLNVPYMMLVHKRAQADLEKFYTFYVSGCPDPSYDDNTGTKQFGQPMFVDGFPSMLYWEHMLKGVSYDNSEVFDQSFNPTWRPVPFLLLDSVISLLQDMLLGIAVNFKLRVISEDNHEAMIIREGRLYRVTHTDETEQIPVSCSDRWSFMVRYGSTLVYIVGAIILLCCFACCATCIAACSAGVLTVTYNVVKKEDARKRMQPGNVDLSSQLLTRQQADRYFWGCVLVFFGIGIGWSLLTSPMIAVIFNCIVLYILLKYSNVDWYLSAPVDNPSNVWWKMDSYRRPIWFAFGIGSLSAFVLLMAILTVIFTLGLAYTFFLVPATLIAGTVAAWFDSALIGNWLAWRKSRYASAEVTVTPTPTPQSGTEEYLPMPPSPMMPVTPSALSLDSIVFPSTADVFGSVENEGGVRSDRDGSSFQPVEVEWDVPPYPPGTIYSEYDTDPSLPSHVERS